MKEWQRWVLLPVTVPMLLVYAALWFLGGAIVNMCELVSKERVK